MPRKKPHKRSSKKHTPRPPKARSGQLSFKDIADETALKFVTRPRRGSIYDPIRERIERFTAPGKGGFEIPVPAGATARALHNRLNVYLKRNPPKLKPGLSFDKRTVEGEKSIAVICIAAPKAK